MKTTTITFAIVTALLVISAIAVSETQIAEAKTTPKHFKAKIDASQEVLDNVPDSSLWDDVTAKGHAIFKLSKDGSKLQYEIKINKIENIVGMHIHNGMPGMNHHDHLVDIIPSQDDPVDQIGKNFEISGVITSEDVLPDHDQNERTLEDLINAMSNSHAYLQVHTDADSNKSTNTGPGDLYTPGEVRGNISPNP